VPTFAFDYGYLGEETENTPLLIGKDSETRWIVAEVVPVKGDGYLWCIGTFEENVVRLGHAKVCLKCDQEPSILALRREASRDLRLREINVIFGDVPVADSQSNGLAERAVQDVKGLVRTLRQAKEKMLGFGLSDNSQMLPWLVKHAAACLNRGQRGPDG
jgi:hypothetical protein